MPTESPTFNKKSNAPLLASFAGSGDVYNSIGVHRFPLTEHSVYLNHESRCDILPPFKHDH